jgi:hypothetical protein
MDWKAEFTAEELINAAHDSKPVLYKGKPRLQAEGLWHKHYDGFLKNGAHVYLWVGANDIERVKASDVEWLPTVDEKLADTEAERDAALERISELEGECAELARVRQKYVDEAYKQAACAVLAETERDDALKHATQWKIAFEALRDESERLNEHGKKYARFLANAGDEHVLAHLVREVESLEAQNERLLELLEAGAGTDSDEYRAAVDATHTRGGLDPLSATG